MVTDLELTWRLFLPHCSDGSMLHQKEMNDSFSKSLTSALMWWRFCRGSQIPAERWCARTRFACRELVLLNDFNALRWRQLWPSPCCAISETAGGYFITSGTVHLAEAARQEAMIPRRDQGLGAICMGMIMSLFYWFMFWLIIFNIKSPKAPMAPCWAEAWSSLRQPRWNSARAPIMFPKTRMKCFYRLYSEWSHKGRTQPS